MAEIPCLDCGRLCYVIPAYITEFHSNDPRYTRQTVFKTICAACNTDLMAWQGTDPKGHLSQLYPISPKHFDDWLALERSSKVQHVHLNAATTVKGSVREKHSGKYILKSVPVK